MDPTLSVDFTADAAYLLLNDHEVVRTCEVAHGVQVDLDEYDMVAGVEVLDLDAVIPRSELIDRFHVRDEQLFILDSVRPSVSSFVSRQPELEFQPGGARVTA